MKKKHRASLTAAARDIAGAGTTSPCTIIDADGEVTRLLIPAGRRRPLNLESCLFFISDHPDVPHGIQRVAQLVRIHLRLDFDTDAGWLPADPVALAPILASLWAREPRGVEEWRRMIRWIRLILILCCWVSLRPNETSIPADPLGDLMSSDRPYRTRPRPDQPSSWGLSEPPH
jgi:hypothetical protein